MSTACRKPPAGWTCSRLKDHEGPCAASPITLAGVVIAGNLDGGVALVPAGGEVVWTQRTLTPADVHPSHDVCEEGIIVSDPVCQKCFASVHGTPEALTRECPGSPPPRPARPTAGERAFVATIHKRMTPGECQAMRELLG